MTAQVAAVRSSSRRLLDELRRGLAGTRMVLLAPVRAQPEILPGKPGTPARHARARISEPRPLAVPDPRLLHGLDSRIQNFVKENPAVESIFTRELVRDVDSGVLDGQKLLEKSGLEIAFDFDDAGAIRKPRVRKSSGVPSIDHLALETARLLEKYQLLAAFRGARRMSISIRVRDQIVVRLEGEVAEPAGLDDMARRVKATLTLLRFAIAKSSAAFMLQDIDLEAKDSRVALIKVFDKQNLIDYLTKYYQDESAK